MLLQLKSIDVRVKKFVLGKRETEKLSWIYSHMQKKAGSR